MHQLAIAVSLTRFSPGTIIEGQKHHSTYNSLYSINMTQNCVELGLTLLKLRSVRDFTFFRGDIPYDNMWISNEE